MSAQSATREGFWAEQAEKQLEWFQKWDTVLEWDFHKADIKWFLNGKLNVSYNCLDRHVNAGAGDQTALIWQGNNQDESKKFSYAELWTRSASLPMRSARSE